jgi:Uma2 family endonuclease
VPEKLTIEDFEKLPPALAYNHELVDGELVDVRERRLGTVLAEQEYDFGGNAHGPDISFFSPAKEHLADEDRRVQPFVPDLAVEIVSKNDTFESIDRKAYFYSAAADRILRDTDNFESATIPGFRIRIADLFDQV